MLDDQFISSHSWLPSPRFELRTLAGYATKAFGATTCHSLILVHSQCWTLQLKNGLGFPWAKQSNDADRHTTQTRNKRAVRHKGKQYCHSVWRTSALVPLLHRDGLLSAKVPSAVTLTNGCGVSTGGPNPTVYIYVALTHQQALYIQSPQHSPYHEVSGKWRPDTRSGAIWRRAERDAYLRYTFSAVHYSIGLNLLAPELFFFNFSTPCI